jgi:hypothetical protein
MSKTVFLTRLETYKKLIEYIEKKCLDNSHLNNDDYQRSMRGFKQNPEHYPSPRRPEFGITNRKDFILVNENLYNLSGELIDSYMLAYHVKDGYKPIMNSIKKYLELKNILYREYKDNIYITPDEPYYIDL